MTLREIVNEELICEVRYNYIDENKIIANEDITNKCIENIEDKNKLIKALEKYFKDQNEDIDIDLKKLQVFSEKPYGQKAQTQIKYDGKLLKIKGKYHFILNEPKKNPNPLSYFIEAQIKKTPEKRNEKCTKTANETLQVYIKEDPDFVKKQIINYLSFLKQEVEVDINLGELRAECLKNIRNNNNNHNYYTIAFFYNEIKLNELNDTSIKKIVKTFIYHNFKSTKGKEQQRANELKDETTNIFANEGKKTRNITNIKEFKKIEKKVLGESVIITRMPCGVSYKDNGKTINVYNGKSEKKSMLASNGVDSYITIPGDIRIGIESKAHDSDQYDPITPILYLIFNANNNTTAGDYAIGLIDGKVINQLKKNNLDYNISGKTVFIGDEKFEKKEDRMALKNCYKDRKEWIQEDGSGRTKYILNNISIPKLGLNTIHPILGHDEYIDTIIKPLSKLYDYISLELSSAKTTSEVEVWKKSKDENQKGTGYSVDTSNIKPSVDNIGIINNLIKTVKCLKETCENINKNFSTTIGTEYIKKFDIILNRLNGVNNQKNIITVNWDEIKKSQEKKEYANAASVKTKYFNY